MKTHEVSQAFEALRLGGPTGAPYRGLPVPGLRQVLLAVGNDDSLHLLAGLEDGGQAVDDRASAGIHLGTVKLFDRGPTQTFVDLALQKPHLKELFCAVVADATEDLTADIDRSADTCLAMVLRRWRELIDSATATMGQERQTGLFGELWVLREIVRASGPSVAPWVGPQGGHHDFAGATGVDLEVKASRSDGPRVVDISGLTQLALSGAQHLYLAVLAIRRVNSGGESIRSLVDELATLGCRRDRVLENLLMLGVGDDLLSTLDAQFDVADIRMYRVGAGFPRLTIEMITEPIDDRVLGVGYRLDLTGEMPEALSREEHAAVYASVGTRP